LRHSPVVPLGSPSNNAINVPVNDPLTWNSDYNNEYPNYHLQVSTNSNFSTFVYNQIVTTLPFVVPNLQHNTTYYWRVKLSTESSQWSPTRQFTTASLII